jgi:cytosine/adenosine deaminase-related metal-dependent hydrolase
MPQLVRGEYVIADPSAMADGVIPDGAIVIDGARIVAVGPWSRLRDTYGHLESLGGPDDWLVLPGLVNAHHHGRGISTLAMGLPDAPLEVWSPSLTLYRGLDFYTNTLYAAARMLLSGVTTSIHSHYHAGPLTAFRESVQAPLTAYRDAGVRVAFAVGISDQHYLAYVPDHEMTAGMSASLSDDVQRWFAPSHCYVGIADYLAVFDAASEWCRREYPLGRLMLSPRGFQWASETLLGHVAELSRRRKAGVQFHFLETRYQREYVSRNFGASAVEMLNRVGLLGPHVSLAHAVWVSDADLDRLAGTGTTLVTNTSSNLRLGSGVIPFHAVRERGINVAIGLDSLTLAEDDDMFAEMRLLGTLHRRPGLTAPWPSPYEVLQMATVDGARAAGFDGQVGRLIVGYRADVTIVNLRRLRAPYTDPRADVPALALSRARASDVDTVIVDGQVLVRNRALTRINLPEVETKLAATCRAGEDQRDESRRSFVRRLQEHLRGVYAGWDDSPSNRKQGGRKR